MPLPHMELPDTVRAAIEGAVLVAERAMCERHALQSTGLECLVCAHPVRRKNAPDDPLSMVVVCGAADAAESFVRRMGAVLEAAALNVPSLRNIPVSCGQVLLAPWMFRGEFRAAVVASVNSPEQAADALMLSTFGRGLDLNVAGHNLRSLLMEFVFEEKQPLGQRLKRMLVGRQVVNYSFPLHCTINEVRSSSGVIWSVGFADMEMVERAQLTVASWLITRKPRHISQAEMSPSTDVDDSVLSEICIWAERSTVESRQEMARLIKHLLLSLNQFTFSSDVENEEFEEAVRS